jgi:hypothetical protein
MLQDGELNLKTRRGIYFYDPASIAGSKFLLDASPGKGLMVFLLRRYQTRQILLYHHTMFAHPS